MTAIADKRASRKEGNNSIIPETTHVISARKHITYAFGLFDQPQSTLLQPREKEIKLQTKTLPRIIGVCKLKLCHRGRKKRM